MAEEMFLSVLIYLHMSMTLSDLFYIFSVTNLNKSSMSGNDSVSNFPVVQGLSRINFRIYY